MKDYKKKIEQIDNLLLAKEMRYKYQKELVEKFNNTLISFMLNIPGEIKTNETINKFHKKYNEEIEKILKDKEIDILFKDFRKRNTGDESFFVVDKDAFVVKKLMIDLENSKKETRLLDIDVFDKNMNQISRGDLGISGRKCLICDKEAKICMRERNHLIDELIDETYRLMEG